MDSKRAVSAYLTAIFKIIPGLVLLFALVACKFSGDGASIATPSPENLATLAHSTTRPTEVDTSAARTSTPPPPSTPVTPLQTLDVQPGELEGLTISFWHPWQAAQGLVLQSIVDEFNRTNRWGIKVQVKAYEDFEALETAIEAALPMGEMPDLLIGYQDQALHWDQGGLELVDVNEYVGDPTWGLTAEEQQDFYLPFWEQDMLPILRSAQPGAEKRLGIPLHRSAQVIYYNRTWAEELGYDAPPTTPFEFRTQACAAAEQNTGSSGETGTGGWMVAALPSKTPGREIFIPPSLLVGWIYAYGGQIALPDGSGYQFNSQEAERALNFIKGLQEARCASVTTNAYPENDFAARRALFYIASLADLPALHTAFMEADNLDEWTVIPYPTADGGPVIVAYGPSLVIPRSTPAEQLAAWTLLQWLVYPPNQAKWVTANGSLPTRASTQDFLNATRDDHPQWAATLDLLPYAQTEPSYASWSTVRWMLGDALAQLFSAQFIPEQIPALLEEMDRLASEIYIQVR